MVAGLGQGFKMDKSNRGRCIGDYLGCFIWGPRYLYSSGFVVISNKRTGAIFVLEFVLEI